MKSSIKYLCLSVALLATQVTAHEMQVSGYFEIEAGAASGYTNEKTSDLVLASAALTAAGVLNELLSAQITLLHEEDETPLEVDEAILFINSGQSTYVNLGQMYLPFGSFESMQISDPLTHEMSELRETAVLVGYNPGLFALTAYAFNGDVDRNAEDRITSYGFSSDFNLLEQRLILGAGYLSNLLDSDTLQEVVAASLAEPNHHIGALNLRAAYRTERILLLAEAIHSLEHLMIEGVEYKPQATHAEVGFTFGSGYTVSIAHQTTDDIQWSGLPRRAWLCTASKSLINDDLTLSVEYRRDGDYIPTEGGSGESSHGLVFQLAAAF